ncbi:ABC transporter permease [Agromyces aerolatus]|uniref:ABC transporter permease n=1 Tax=Agromyces sp. LY-1074 TaxID=3074080 RepID=UPI002860740A|nr:MULTISPECIES: ABC transporter permease [unclassified Agromyces]MDR5699469.1 ABC transporter permease [Agromyces sp. LY-1074]MDR5705765.1 ABC transporter permease [Agromyces sp. LY-1358]
MTATVSRAAAPPAERRSGLRSFGGWLGGATRGASTLRLVLSLTLFFVLWQLIATYVIDNRLLIVPPTEVFTALGEEIGSGIFWTHFSTTMLELAIAFPIAVAGGFAIGAILAASKPVRQTLDPMLTALYSLPIVALAPLFTAGLGFGIASKIAIIILMAIFPVITNTDAGLRSADSALVETSRSFRATRLQTLKTVTLPHSVPFIISGIRVAFARALVGVIVAEFFGAIAGFGFAIAAAAQSYQTARLLGYVVVLGAVGLLASIALTALERRLAPWRED